MRHETELLLIAAAGVAVLLVLVARLRLHAFLALAVVSLGVGLAAGLEPLAAARAFQEGVGGTLGLIAVVVGLGTMLGRLLAESGGAGVIAGRFAEVFGARRLDWGVLLAAFVVGLPVFFGVGLVLLAPVVFALAGRTPLPMLRLMLPLTAGLAVCHSLVPPHPGPVVAVGSLGADMGRTILWSVLIGLPTAALAGPVLAARLARRVRIEPGGLGAQLQPTRPAPRPPGFSVSLLTILTPVLLMVLAVIASLAWAKDDPRAGWAAFAGSPLVAMLAATLLALFTLGRRCGFSAAELLRFTEECAGPAATIFLVVGAGGGFSRVLDLAGVDDAIAAWGRDWRVSPLLAAWLMAALLRVAVGSATVAITMAAAIAAPLAEAQPGVNRELLVVALGAGTLALSHVNDGGFWLVKEWFGLTVLQTLRTWTVMITVASVAALGGVLLADQLLR
ncbi:MAG: gluconate:H+ symporter [Limisphaerales bacterium]